MVRIVVIDNDPHTHAVLQMSLPRECALLPATTGLQGFRLVEEEDPDVVLLAVELPDADGMQLLPRILELPEAPPVIMMTTRKDTKTIVEAIRIGAHNFISKPVDPGKFLILLQTAVQIAAIRHAVIGDAPMPQIIGSSPAIRRVKDITRRYATSNSAVLIIGETGTGKELVAQSIHDLSKRGNESYVPINCGAIPETLMETELFGSEKGAYTDAVARPGVFERAHRGTLFLDEIGDMLPHHQVKLLRVLEDRSFNRVGGSRTIQSDIRIISATNCDLATAVRNGAFRRDLFYRVSTLPIEIPPLRARRVDIPELTRAFLDKFSEDCGQTLRISSSALEKLIDYDWPGNVRELRNVIERAILFAEDGMIRPCDISLLGF